MGITDDIKGVFERDPAAKNILEVLTCYPGLHALWMHRVAHFLWNLKIPVLPRFVSHVNRFFTGIEIHPGATIGRRFFIDHGCGVVIGETTEIGDNVLLYSEVVLGGTSLEKKKRHPTLCDNVVVGTGAKVLGAITLGEGAKVGAGSVVVKDVPPGATAVGIPAKIVKKEDPKKKTDLRHGDLPDPLAHCVECIFERMDSLQEELVSIKKTLHQEETAIQPTSETAESHHSVICDESICSHCMHLGLTDKEGGICQFHQAKANFQEYKEKIKNQEED